MRAADFKITRRITQSLTNYTSAANSRCASPTKSYPQALHISLAADVRFDKQGLSVSLFNGFHDRLSLALTPAGNNDLRSRFSQLAGSGLADARSSASNQSTLFFSEVFIFVPFVFSLFFISGFS